MSENETENSPTPSYAVERDGYVADEGLQRASAVKLFDSLLPAVATEGGYVKIIRDDGAVTDLFRRHAAEA